MKIESFLLKKLSEKAYKEAEKNVNSSCIFWHHQPKVPESLVKLSKYNN